MAVVPPVIKVGARLVAAAILALVLAAPILPASAAPRFQFGHRGGNGGPAFNMDSDPCASQFSGRRRGQACPSDRFQLPRGLHGPREPGSNAFGLQFNSDGD